jgi:hypothetical protein
LIKEIITQFFAGEGFCRDEWRVTCGVFTCTYPHAREGEVYYAGNLFTEMAVSPTPRQEQG